MKIDVRLLSNGQRIRIGVRLQPAPRDKSPQLRRLVLQHEDGRTMRRIVAAHIEFRTVLRLARQFAGTSRRPSRRRKGADA